MADKPTPAETEGLRAAVELAAEHFAFLAKLAVADRVAPADKSDKRKKWQIVRDEAKTGAEHMRAALSRAKGE